MAGTDFVTVEQQRGDCFKLLAACFYPPERKMLLDEEVLENLFRLLGAVCPEAAPYAEGMARALSQAPEEELAVAHAKLFVGPFELQAPPYGSLYLESQKRMMGESTMEVLKMYQKAGLVLSTSFQDAPDHIAVELEFMYFLIAKELQALRKGDRKEAFRYLEMQQEFHDKYLRPWIEPFGERIKTASEHEFYTLLAKSLSTFITKRPVPGTLPEKFDTEV
ncbi:MAG: molecular chaperone TorD family protein [Deltaproteobacteria bacterium]|nr:molecular chaperone TorD family protein [Deltaproteobacteria bacterium]